MKEEEKEDKCIVVGGGGSGGVRVRKLHRGGGQLEGDGRYALLNINILWPFVNFIGMFTSLLNSTRVLN